MSTGTKELSEMLRAVSAILVEGMGAMQDDGKFSKWEGIKALHLIPTVLTGIKGLARVPDEAQDLTMEEWESLTDQIAGMLVSVGLTHRTRDVADRVLDLAYHNICEITRIIKLPPTAELVKE